MSDWWILLACLSGWTLSVGGFALGSRVTRRTMLTIMRETSPRPPTARQPISARSTADPASVVPIYFRRPAPPDH